MRNTITVSWKTTDCGKNYISPKKRQSVEGKKHIMGEKIYTIPKKIHSAGREESQKQQLLNKYFIYHTITVSMVHTMGVKDIHCYTEVETRTPPS